MYTEKERAHLLSSIVEYLRGDDNFEGLVQMGTGAEGYRDIYSDIDLMAGCRDVTAAGEKLYAFFNGFGAVYIDRRRWSDTVRGCSAYWENGLSLDISFMPIAQIPIQSSRIAIIFSKTDGFTRQIETGLQKYQPPRIDDSVHHRFFYALRRCEIAVLRGEFIYADMTLAEAREILLRVRSGGGDAKRFDELDTDFLSALEKTYPTARDRDAICRAKAQMLSLYLDCGCLSLDNVQFKLIGCFQ